jgi:hypothetical protein
VNFGSAICFTPVPANAYYGDISPFPHHAVLSVQMSAQTMPTALIQAAIRARRAVARNGFAAHGVAYTKGARHRAGSIDALQGQAKQARWA